MTDVTDLGELVVVGQRRRPGGTFPSAGGGGGGGNTGVPTQVEVGQEDPNPEQPSYNPCASADTALEWNADAAAAEALRRMLATAAAQNDTTHDLANREYGAMICQGANGSLSISPIQWGDPTFDSNGVWLNPGQQPTVDVNFFACGTGTTPLAMIHSHPSTGPSGAIPSRPDAAWVAAINNARGDNIGRIYVASIGSDGSFRIEIYNETNVEAGSERGEPGPEVNPDGQPCQGVVIG